MSGPQPSQHTWRGKFTGKLATASPVQLQLLLCHQRMVVAPCVFELMGKIPNRFSLFDRFFPFLLSLLLRLGTWPGDQKRGSSGANKSDRKNKDSHVWLDYRSILWGWSCDTCFREKLPNA